MQRHWLGRVSVALWTLWFAAVMTVPSVLRLCPMHDAPRAAAASGALAHPASHANHAEHGRTGHPGSDSRPCHCPGHCSAAAGVALPGPVVALTFDVAAGPPAPIAPAPLPTLTAPSHLLPFANGPPAALG